MLPLVLWCLFLWTPRPAQAQTTLEAKVGFGQGLYRPQHWFPVRLVLTNQGTPTHVEVRARLEGGRDANGDYRLAEQELQSSAKQAHTLYLRSPNAYGAAGVAVDLVREGRVINTLNPTMRPVDLEDWLVISVPSTFQSLNLLNGNPGPAHPMRSRNARYGRGGQPTVNVAPVDPADLPERWQGLEAVDLIALGDVGEREFTPEQTAALRDYVRAGGALVVCGGLNWNRLAGPWFAEILPVRVTGVATHTRAARLRDFAGVVGPSGAAFPLCTSVAKPDAEVLASEGNQPLVARRRLGAGWVYYVAFDPGLAPFRQWDGINAFWKEILRHSAQGARILPQLAAHEDSNDGGYSGSGRPGNLADAPFSISQLDVPAFYLVALFLLAYIIVLVPVNYLFLKARDRKEYAWLTTPAIVIVFSFGAYMIGYGFKGGRTVLVNVGVVEAIAGQSSAPFLNYAGLFSPRKGGYRIQVSGSSPEVQAAAGSTLLGEPQSTQARGSVRSVQDDSQRLEDFAVDMWSMRIVKAEGLAALGRGVRWTSTGHGKGKVRNDTPYALENCFLIGGGRVAGLGNIAPGQEAAAGEGTHTGAYGTLLPPLLVSRTTGAAEQQRIRRAVLDRLCSQNASPPVSPLLIGWIPSPVLPITVDGRIPRTQSATLLIVHLPSGSL